jgi:hypothetical protein
MNQKHHGAPYDMRDLGFATAVLFLLSPAAAYVNGLLLPVDGAWALAQRAIFDRVPLPRISDSVALKSYDAAVSPFCHPVASDDSSCERCSLTCSVSNACSRHRLHRQTPCRS